MAKVRSEATPLTLPRSGGRSVPLLPQVRPPTQTTAQANATTPKPLQVPALKSVLADRNVLGWVLPRFASRTVVATMPTTAVNGSLSARQASTPNKAHWGSPFLAQPLTPPQSRPLALAQAVRPPTPRSLALAPAAQPPQARSLALAPAVRPPQPRPLALAEAATPPQPRAQALTPMMKSPTVRLPPTVAAATARTVNPLQSVATTATAMKAGTAPASMARMTTGTVPPSNQPLKPRESRQERREWERKEREAPQRASVLRREVCTVDTL